MTAAPIVLAVASAALAAAALRLPSLLSTALAGYVFLAGQIAVVTWALSPLDAVTETGLTIAEALVLVAAAAAWWLRGRPLPSFAGARAELGTVARDPLTAAFLAVLALGLGYELLLAVTVPPNNWDSLTYHLSRVAAWHQSHGIHWIENAPTGRLNEFQPLAEQQILFLVTATGSTVLYALPQYVAQLAILAAVYGAARRLGFEPTAAARGTAVLAMLSLVALEASTAQNDLVAASFPVTAACLLLGGGPVEAALAGVAVALGLGVKLTTALTLPVLAWLAWRAGRRTLVLAGAGAALGLAAAAVWGFVLNLAHTGHLLGHGQGRVENTVSPSVTHTVRMSLHLAYRLFDLSLWPNWLSLGFAAAGVVIGIALVARSRSPRAAIAALPLFVPAIALVLIDVIDQDPSHVPRSANEDVSSFGPIGTAVLLGAIVVPFVGGRIDSRRVALALALPSYMVLLAIDARYNVWITRFLVVPVALTAPLFAGLCRKNALAATLLALGGVTLGFALVADASKKLYGSAGRPWTLSQVGAMRAFPAQPTGAIVADALAAYDRAVPERACVGAVLDPDEPSYLLWGPSLRRRVVFLPSLTAVDSAYRKNVGYVVVSTGANAPVAKAFAAAGWTVKPLGSYWQLAVAPTAKRASVFTTC